MRSTAASNRSSGQIFAEHSSLSEMELLLETVYFSLDNFEWQLATSLTRLTRWQCEVLTF